MEQPEEKINFIYCHFPNSQNFRSIIDALKPMGDEFDMRFTKGGICIQESNREGMILATFSIYAEDMLAYDYMITDPYTNADLGVYFARIRTDNFFNVIKGDKKAGVTLIFYINIFQDLTNDGLKIQDTMNGVEKVIPILPSGGFVQEYTDYYREIIEMGSKPNSIILGTNLSQIVDGFQPKSGKKHGTNPVMFIRDEMGAIMVVSMCGGQFQGKCSLPTGTKLIDENDSPISNTEYISLLGSEQPNGHFRVEVTKLQWVTKVSKISPVSTINIYMVDGYPLTFLIKFSFGHCIFYYKQM